MQASNLLISANQKIDGERGLASFNSKSTQNENEEMNIENKQQTKLSYDPPLQELVRILNINENHIMSH